MNGIESLLKQQDLSVPLSTAQGVSNVPFQRWFKFKEAFSPKFVHDTIQKSLIKVDKILDPFGGSGTTALTSQLMGIKPTTIEVNPFLADLIECKLTEYNTQKLISDWVFVSKNVGLENPSLDAMFFNSPKTLFEDKGVDRWIFNREIILRIAQYREVIKKLDDSKSSRLFRVLLGSIMIPFSNVIINGKGRRYRKNWEILSFTKSAFDEALRLKVEEAIFDIVRYSNIKSVTYNFFNGDSRSVLSCLDCKQDLIVFSPPYPNSFDYTDIYIGIKGKVILSLDVRLSKVRILDVGCDSSTHEIEMHNFFSAEIEKILSLSSVNISYCQYAHDCSILSVFPDAENADADADIYDLKAQKITYNCAELEKHTDDFYQKELKYPSSTMMIWDKQTEFKLIAKAETRISARLGDSLQNKLGKENVAAEPNVISGRIDIFIHSNAMSVDHGPCIIELKVLRHEKSDNYNRRWLYKGVLQARDYTLDMDAKSKYLFSFDGREINREFAVIPIVAGRYNVKYLNFRMYNKTDQARDEEIEDQSV